MKRSRSQVGFTYLMLLWWVAISGVLLTALAQRWTVEAQRQKEMDLVFKAGQIKSAIEAYAKVPVHEGAGRYPGQLSDLLEDRRTGSVRHHLRRLWPDPITGQPWGLIRDQEGIKGVFSLSRKKPMRGPDGVLTFSEWRFEAASNPAPSP
ncbi:MAG: type II secretion system protein [Aquabacterium sp.]|uniref:type II secretion system protein n=1 Tax=Aquabacterium sp. TaxID=1872578 RepID=UPI0025BF9E66|nr:type II secretion system protein [Aquabacterium sp.]MBI5924866.1 type II secretion system protein [Aquabacterium sp.]